MVLAEPVNNNSGLTQDSIGTKVSVSELPQAVINEEIPQLRVSANDFIFDGFLFYDHNHVIK